MTAALFPAAWLSLFTADAQVIEAGGVYLRAVGPFYGFFGLGMSLYFASQGAGALKWPLLGGLMRIIVAVGGGWLVLRWTGSLAMVFLTLGVALAVFGIVIAVSVWRGVWFVRSK